VSPGLLLPKISKALEVVLFNRYIQFPFQSWEYKSHNNAHKYDQVFQLVSGLREIVGKIISHSICVKQELLQIIINIWSHQITVTAPALLVLSVVQLVMSARQFYRSFRASLQD
jgi:hypothetical protein